MCECLPAALAQCKFSTYWNRSNQLYAYAMLTLTRIHSECSWLSFWFWFQFSSLVSIFWPTLFRLNNSPAVDFAVVGFFLLFSQLAINIYLKWKNKQRNCNSDNVFMCLLYPSIAVFALYLSRSKFATAHTLRLIYILLFQLIFITSVQYFDRNACFSRKWKW